MTSTSPTVNVTSGNFEQLIDEPGMLVVDFWAEWCGPCRMFAPIFERAAQKHPDIRWGKVNTEEQPQLAGALGIQSIPTLMVFRDGVLLFEQPGVIPGPALDRLVEEIRGLDMDEVRSRIAAEDAERAREEKRLLADEA